jgi:UDP-2,3-diacylglucosamine pyrophosphatase LpxH
VILLFNSQGRRRALSTYFSFLLIPERRKVIRIKLRKKKKKKKNTKEKMQKAKKKKKTNKEAGKKKN